jgi:uncharacterized protein YneF (UPF0154 family)
MRIVYVVLLVVLALVLWGVIRGLFESRRYLREFPSREFPHAPREMRLRATVTAKGWKAILPLTFGHLIGLWLALKVTRDQRPSSVEVRNSKGATAPSARSTLRSRLIYDSLMFIIAIAGLIVSSAALYVALHPPNNS